VAAGFRKSPPGCVGILGTASAQDERITEKKRKVKDRKARTLGQRESTGINGQAHLRTVQENVR
jgi:hypothetical protein